MDSEKSSYVRRLDVRVTPKRTRKKDGVSVQSDRPGTGGREGWRRTISDKDTFPTPSSSRVPSVGGDVRREPPFPLRHLSDIQPRSHPIPVSATVNLDVEKRQGLLFPDRPPYHSLVCPKKRRDTCSKTGILSLSERGRFRVQLQEICFLFPTANGRVVRTLPTTLLRSRVQGPRAEVPGNLLKRRTQCNWNVTYQWRR